MIGVAKGHSTVIAYILQSLEPTKLKESEFKMRRLLPYKHLDILSLAILNKDAICTSNFQQIRFLDPGC